MQLREILGGAVDGDDVALVHDDGVTDDEQFGRYLGLDAVPPHEGRRCREAAELLEGALGAGLERPADGGDRDEGGGRHGGISAVTDGEIRGRGDGQQEDHRVGEGLQEPGEPGAPMLRDDDVRTVGCQASFGVGRGEARC